MELSLLGLHPLNQLFDSIKHSLVGDAGRHMLVMLDLAVEFDALVAHFSVPRLRLLYDNEAVDLFISKRTTAKDLAGPEPRKDAERETREAVMKDVDKTDGADRDLVHGEGGTIDLPNKPSDVGRDD
jgi:hypothetical protein